MPKKKLMKARTQRPAKVQDPDHHLCHNRGYWWVGCSINATKYTIEKLAFSLRTPSIFLARLRRDVFLAALQRSGLEVRLRKNTGVTLAAVQMSAEELAKPWRDRVEQAYKAAMAVQLHPGEALGEDPLEPWLSRRSEPAHLFVKRHAVGLRS